MGALQSSSVNVSIQFVRALTDLTSVALVGVPMHDLSMHRLESIRRQGDGCVHDHPVDWRVTGRLGERALVVEEGVGEVSIQPLIH